MEKSPIFLGAVGGVDGQTGVSLALNAEHARQRRALGYLFTNSALRQFENLMKIQVEKFIAVLGQMADEKQPADLSSWCRYRLSSDFTCDLTDETYRHLPCFRCYGRSLLRRTIWMPRTGIGHRVVHICHQCLCGSGTYNCPIRHLLFSQGISFSDQPPGI